MQQQNKANRLKLKNKENKRISNLIERCYKDDPRIKKYKEELKV